MLTHIIEHDGDSEDVISDDDLKAVGKSIMNFVFALRQEEFPEHDFIVIATLCLNSLKCIVQADPEFTVENIGDLLGISKSFMLFSIPDITQQPPARIASSQQAIMDPVSLKPNKRGNGINSKSRKSRKPVKKKSEPAGKQQDDSHRSYGMQEASMSLQHFSTLAYRTSDSDFSDTETSRESVSRHKQSKLRLSALSLISLVALTVEKKILFGYWHSLFSTEETSSPTLINSVIKDSSPRCRILALQTIILLLKNSKPFLIQAENKDNKPSNFTPFSVTLGNMISFMYGKLTQAVINEGDLTVLTQILKCISIFIPATPFNRLKAGIVTSFVKYVRLLIRHNDPTIKVAALIVMGNLISIQDITSEIYELVEIPKSKIEFSWKKIDESIRSTGVNQEDDDEIIDLEFEDEDEGDVEVKPETVATKMPWLLQVVLENLGVYGGLLKSPSPATSVRIESLQVLSAMSSHFLLLKDHLLPISMAIVKSMQNPLPDEKLYAGRALDTVGSSLNIYLTQDKKNLQDLETAVGFWLNIMPKVVERIQDENQAPALRSTLADGLANVGVHVFERFEHQKQILLISVLTGCSYDDDANVKSSAIRALAVFVLFPSLRDDLCFVENTIESILRIIKDQNVLTRTKASWSLGNVVDALLMIRENKSINERLFRKILETSLEATADNDRVKVNAVRTIGNLITLLTREQLNDQSWLKLFEESIQCLHNLLLNCGNVKVKWNVCYSFASLMKTSLFFEPSLKFMWQELVFTSLCSIIRTSPNFKVRINACVAFTIPSRENFGGYFIDIWSCLLAALEQSNNLTDFNEYKHRDTLQDQLCSSICHVISVATAEDVVQMKNEVFPLIDITKQNWNRVFNRLLPECQGKILATSESLKTITCKSTEQKNSVDILMSCFQPVEQF